jgi:hypothetical protein
MEKFPGYARYQLELKMARAARASGNEGKARVCARRAAGIVVGEYLKQNGYPISDPSAYALLKYLCSLPEIPGEIRQVADHFLLRVDKDQNLPIPVDLVAEVAWLENKLIIQ